MKKIVILFTIAIMLFQFVGICEYSTEDYSWLDDLTIKQIKELDSEIHKRIPIEGTETPNDLVDDGTYSDDEIESLLLSGRWTMTSDTGTAFLDFTADHKGKITGMVDFTWTISNGSVFLDFTTDQSYHREFVFEASGGTVQLVNEGQSYILNGSSDNMINIIGTWHVANDNSVELVLNADGTFKLNVSGLTYAGSWGINGSTLVLTQNGINISGQYNGTNIGLNIGGNNFTFTH